MILNLNYPHRASYYDDWLDAFVQSRHFLCSVENIIGLKAKTLEAKIRDFDAVIILHSCSSDTLQYLEPLASALAARKGAKLLVFVGNEYNSPYVSMTRRIGFLKSARADFVATQLLLEAGEYLYGQTECRTVSIPHALNPIAFSPGGSSDRDYDLGVKGFRYPPYLGDDDRNIFISQISASARDLGLKTDISEDQRLSRNDWAAFLGNCRGTVSTETGSFYLSPDDDLMNEIHRYLRSKDRGFVLKSEGKLRSAARHLPAGVKSTLWKLLRLGPLKFEMIEDFNTSFAELEAKFFKTCARAPVYSKAISSRHFDAIGTKTCQIMLEGRYNDILVPDVHYIPVKSDLSNIGDSLAAFSDPGYSSKISEQAYEFVLENHTYVHRAKAVFDLLG